MEETNNLWNKTAAELTVKDTLIVAIITPALVVGGVVVMGTVLTAVEKIGKKLRRTKPELQIVTEEN